MRERLAFSIFQLNLLLSGLPEGIFGDLQIDYLESETNLYCTIYRTDKKMVERVIKLSTGVLDSDSFCQKVENFIREAEKCIVTSS